MPEASLSYLAPALRVMSGGDSRKLELVKTGREADAAVIERYAVVPSYKDPRVLLPLEAGPAVWHAVLKQYAAGAASPIARTAAQVLGLANRLGTAPLFLRDRISIVSTPAGAGRTPLHDFLAGLLGRDDFVVSLRLAPGRPNGKPVAQVVAMDGQVLAYAKFGWEQLTRRLVRQEGDVLAELGPLCRGTVLRVPAILHKGPWHDLEALVVAPLSGKGITPRSVDEIPAAALLAFNTLRPALTARLADSTFWQRMSSEAARLGPVMSNRARKAVEEACLTAEAKWADREVALGQSHGDFISPNICVLPSGECNIWDWERGESDVPLGTDIMQFILFHEMRRKGSRKPVYDRVMALGHNALSRQSLAPANAEMLLVLSLMRSLLWFGEARQAGRGEDEDHRFTQTLEDCLRAGRDAAKTFKDPPRSAVEADTGVAAQAIRNQPSHPAKGLHRLPADQHTGGPR